MWGRPLIYFRRAENPEEPRDLAQTASLRFARIISQLSKRITNKVTLPQCQTVVVRSGALIDEEMAPEHYFIGSRQNQRGETSGCLLSN